MESIPTITALQEVLEFLTSTPTPQQIIDFHTSEENTELEEISHINHFMRMLKIKAREKLSEE